MKVISRGSALWLLLLAVAPFLAVANEVHGLAIEVLLHPDGSADVTERWDLTFDAGTEFYVRHTRMGDMTLSGWTICETTDGKALPFTERTPWEGDTSRQDKAAHFGISELKGGTFERCWGWGTPGRHIYESRYHLDGLVRSFSDADGFNHTFMELGVPIEEASLTVSRADGQKIFTDDSAFWGFGYEGTVSTDADSLTVTLATDQPMEKGDHLTLMASWPKGWFAPAHEGHPDGRGDGTFEEVKQMALEGSSFEKDDTDGEEFTLWEIFVIIWMVGGIVMVVILALTRWREYAAYGFLLPFLIIWWITTPIKRLNRKMRLERDYPDGFKSWRRDVPLPMGYPEACAIGQEVNVKSRYPWLWEAEENYRRNLVQGQITQLVAWGCLEVARNGKKDVLRTVRPPLPREKGAHHGAAVLGELLIADLGPGKDLTDKEIEQFGKRHRKDLIPLYEKKRNQYLEKYDPKRVVEVIRLRRFLTDSTLIEERRLTEAPLWEGLMVYATMFGVTRQVQKELRKTNPALFELGVPLMTPTDLKVDRLSRHLSRHMQEYTTHDTSSSSSSGRSHRSSRSGGRGRSGGGGGGFR
ncbi:MAG: DUF2207 domain-containing protein [Bacteroidales bacterium]|nr:DUF2207 domain-containing protein [Bacteroidales bacterium]